VTQVGLAGMRSGTALGMESIFLELLVSVKGLEGFQIDQRGRRTPNGSQSVAKCHL
jgi:hypothetical protein